jgi:hypothetical protein
LQHLNSEFLIYQKAADVKQAIFKPVLPGNLTSEVIACFAFLAAPLIEMPVLNGIPYVPALQQPSIP